MELDPSRLNYKYCCRAFEFTMSRKLLVEKSNSLVYAETDRTKGDKQQA
jgi:hypothetical protein